MKICSPSFSPPELRLYIEGHLRLVGVYLDLGLILHPVHIAAAAYMNEGLLAPPCLIDIEGILSDFPVEGNQSLVIDAVVPCLLAGICREVKHVPNERGPQIGPLGEHLQHMLMVNGLILLGVIALYRVGF